MEDVRFSSFTMITKLETTRKRTRTVLALQFTGSSSSRNLKMVLLKGVNGAPLPSISGVGKTTKKLDSGYKFMKMGTNMREAGKTENVTARVPFGFLIQKKI